MEIWDIYDKNRNKTGRTAVRGSSLSDGDYHLVVHVCIFNSRDELLIQHRHQDKKLFPGVWDFSVGGSAQTGDTSQAAAARETAEELGLDRDFSRLMPYFTVNFAHGFDDFYILNEDVDLRALTLQKEEVQNVKWVTKDEVIRLLKEELFVSYHRGLIELIFDMKNKRGAFS